MKPLFRFHKGVWAAMLAGKSAEEIAAILAERANAGAAAANGEHS
jgi:hypothetical protein